MEVIAKEVAKPERLQVCSANNIASMLWSFAALQWDPGEQLVRSLKEGMVENSVLLSSHGFANGLQGLAKLGYDPGEALLQLAFVHFMEKGSDPDKWNLQPTLNVLWSMAVFQRTDHPCFKPLLQHAEKLIMSQIASVRNLDYLSLDDGKHEFQAFQALLAAKLDHGMDYSNVIEPEMYEYLEEVLLSRVKDRFKISAMHQDVSRVLRSMGVQHEMEKLTDNGYFSLDIFLQSPNGPVVVEVDGPTHFTINTFKPMGATLLRWRMLNKLGYQVISIPVHDFQRLSTTAAKAEYLARRLQPTALNLQHLQLSNTGTNMRAGAPDADSQQDRAPLPTLGAPSAPYPSKVLPPLKQLSSFKTAFSPHMPLFRFERVTRPMTIPPSLGGGGTSALWTCIPLSAVAYACSRPVDWGLRGSPIKAFTFLYDMAWV
eukprot:jgi/Botrbrau1/20761/Bobra.0753s0001.1